jgi:hypothetical protein
MLTAADELHVHQTPEPIAVAGTDRNFYDRSYFGAFRPEDGLMVAAAFGVYPHLNIADAHLTVVRDGAQHCLHASKILHSDRTTLRVGPVSIEILEPLQRLRLVVDEHNGLAADLMFSGRHFPIEEPRFIHRFGPRAFMDYTRLSQAASVTGWVAVDGRRLALEPGVPGLRDRSWGIRPVGVPDPQPLLPPREPQFFWLWTPVHLEGRTLFWHVNADSGGRAWNTRATICPHGAGPDEHVHAHGTMELDLHDGTRWVSGATLSVHAQDGTHSTLRYTPRAHLEMQGLGYRHPQWAHGLPHGELEIARETIALDAADPGHLNRWHRQVLCDVAVDGPDGREHATGVLEHLIIGPYTPLGLQERQ